MRKLLSSATLNAGMLFLGLHVIARDNLLLCSDGFSLLIYSSAATLVLTALGLILLIPVLIWIPTVRREKIWNGVILFAHLGYGALFMILLFRWLFPQFETAGGSKSGLLFLAGYLLSALLLIPTLSITVLKRIERLGLVLFLVMLTSVVFGITYVRWIRPAMNTDPVSPNHWVLIVLDGLPAKHLHTYNPLAPPTVLDSVFSMGRVFTQAYSWQPWTNAWFGTLYDGQSYWARSPDSADTHKNILHLLQEQNVSTRWVVFHRNGIPEGSAAKVGHYKGLRSVFLGPGFAWFPEWLGLDYHLILRSGELTSLFSDNPLRKIGFRFLNGAWKPHNSFVETLLPELRKIRKHASRSLVIFHVLWSKVELPNVSSLKTNLDTNALFEKIAQKDYRYDESDSQTVAFIQERDATFGPRMDVLGRQLREMFLVVDKEETLRGTRFLVTADHGTICEKGRFWYGLHSDEEVLRVPLVLFDGKHFGEDRRWVFTPDIPATLLEQFQITNSVTALGKSILRPDTHPGVFSLTMPAQKRKEWFLALYQGDEKFQIDLHPEGNGQVTTTTVKNYIESNRKVALELPDSLVPQVRKILTNLGISTKQIHTAIATRLFAPP